MASRTSGSTAAFSASGDLEDELVVDLEDHARPELPALDLRRRPGAWPS